MYHVKIAGFSSISIEVGKAQRSFSAAASFVSIIGGATSRKASATIGAAREEVVEHSGRPD
jgi:hypothetical protein